MSDQTTPRQAVFRTSAVVSGTIAAALVTGVAMVIHRLRSKGRRA